MTRLLTLTLTAAMLVPLATTSEAAAHPAPYPHYHPRPHYVPPPRAVVRRPVVVYTPAPTRVVVREAPTHRVVVKRRRAPRNTFGLGLRATTSLMDGFKLGLSPNENGPLGGAGLQARFRFSDNWGLELSVDAMGGGGDDFSQTTVPLMAGLMYNFRPESRLQPYVLAGLGVHFTSLEYLDGRYKYGMTELAGQLGAGVELFLFRWLSLGADVRFQTVVKNLETQAQIRDDCLHNVGTMTGFCDGINRADPDDKLNVGVQFQLGANIYF